MNTIFLLCFCGGLGLYLGRFWTYWSLEGWQLFGEDGRQILTSNGSAEDKLRTMFTALYDQDGNGSIDGTEKMFTMMDKDIDGKIIEQEFI